MKLHLVLLFLFFSVFLTEIATDIYVPCLPFLIKEFGTTQENLQKTMGFHLLGFVLGQGVYGFLADKVGRIRSLSLGLGIFFCSSFCCASSNSIEELIAFRFLQGIGACANPVIALAMIKDLSKNSTNNIQLISLLTMVLSVSPILGPILGAFLLEYLNWKANFYLVGSIAFFLFISSFFGRFISYQEKNFSTPQVNEIKKDVIRPPLISGIRKYFTHLMLRYLLLNALLVSCVWVFITESPFIIIDYYQLSTGYFALALSITVIAYICGGWVVNRMIGKYEANNLLNTGMFIIGGSSFFLFLFWALNQISLLIFIFAIALFEFGLGISRPLIIDKIMNIHSQQHGKKAALIGISEMFVSSLFISASTLIKHNSISAIILITTTSTFYCLLEYYFSRRKKQGKISFE